jgi:hypothetical protein
MSEREPSLAERRLKDIVFISKNGKPVNGASQETIVQLIGDLAKDALQDIQRQSK